MKRKIISNYKFQPNYKRRIRNKIRKNVQSIEPRKNKRLEDSKKRRRNINQQECRVNNAPKWSGNVDFQMQGAIRGNYSKKLQKNVGIQSNKRRLKPRPNYKFETYRSNKVRQVRTKPQNVYHPKNRANYKSNYVLRMPHENKKTAAIYHQNAPKIQKSSSITPYKTQNEDNYYSYSKDTRVESVKRSNTVDQFADNQARNNWKNKSTILEDQHIYGNVHPKSIEKRPHFEENYSSFKNENPGGESHYFESQRYRVNGNRKKVKGGFLDEPAGKTGTALLNLKIPRIKYSSSQVNLANSMSPRKETKIKHNLDLRGVRYDRSKIDFGSNSRMGIYKTKYLF